MQAKPPEHFSKRRIAAIGLGLCVATSSAASFAYENGVTTEAVSNFGGNGDLPGAIPNCDGFRRITTDIPTGLTAPIFSAGPRYTDNQVYDTDFIDPDKSGNTVDNDTNNFDKRGNAISYVCAHGLDQSHGFGATCIDSPCTSAAQCQSAAYWKQNGHPEFNEPHACADPQGPSSGSPARCCYKGPRHIVLNSTQSKHGNLVNYGADPSVKWGESTTGGGWAGAGTNGGAKLVVLDISHGTVPGVSGEILSNMFAGMWVVSTIMPVSGDTAMISNRGSTFADKARINPSGSPSYAWTDTMHSVNGINGIGCYISFGMDSDPYWVDQHVAVKRWIDFTNDNFDSQGNAYWKQVWACNYDTTTRAPSN